MTIKRTMLLILIALSNTFAGKFSDIQIVFINGIQNTDKQAIESAEELSRAIHESREKAEAVYNDSKGMIEDIAETYAYAKMDGTNGGKDFTKFWQLASKKGVYHSLSKR